MFNVVSTIKHRNAIRLAELEGQQDGEATADQTVALIKWKELRTECRQTVEILAANDFPGGFVANVVKRYTPKRKWKVSPWVIYGEPVRIACYLRHVIEEALFALDFDASSKVTRLGGAKAQLCIGADANLYVYDYPHSRYDQSTRLEYRNPAKIYYGEDRQYWGPGYHVLNEQNLQDPEILEACLRALRDLQEQTIKSAKS